MNYKKEMKKMGWNEDEIVNRIKSLGEDNLGLNQEKLDLNAEDLKKNAKDFIETDEEQEAVNSFFNREDE